MADWRAAGHGRPSASSPEWVRDMLPGASVPEGDEATHDKVLANLPGRRIAHFACHGLSDWDDPSRSCLLLRDHQENPLTAGVISGLELAGADLAYLSACSTTDTSPRLADEAIHITSAFQLAGYRNVIGTPWPVNDAPAMRIARDFYGYLTDNGTQPPDTSAAAPALHRAIRRLREDYPELPTRWAAHIHTGS